MNGSKKSSLKLYVFCYEKSAIATWTNFIYSFKDLFEKEPTTVITSQVIGYASMRQAL
jgi:hypothetical protein